MTGRRIEGRAKVTYFRFFCKSREPKTKTAQERVGEKLFCSNDSAEAARAPLFMMSM